MAAVDARSRSAVLALEGGGGGGPNFTGPGDLCLCKLGLELGIKLALLLPPLPSELITPLPDAKSLSRSRSLSSVGLCGGGGLRGGDITEPSLLPLPVDEGTEGGGPAEGVEGPAVGGTLRPVLENLCPGDLTCPSYPDGTGNSLMSIRLKPTKKLLTPG